MAFENKQKISEIDLDWRDSDYVAIDAGPDNDDHDQDPAALKFAWFKIDLTIPDSEKEEKEKMAAMRVQLENKVINKYGMPYGMTMPKEFKKMIKEKETKKGINKWDRKRKRLIDRQLEKDISADRRNNP